MIDIYKKLENIIKYKNCLIEVSNSFDYEGDDMMTDDQFIQEKKWVKNKLKKVNNRIEIIIDLIYLLGGTK